MIRTFAITLALPLAACGRVDFSPTVPVLIQAPPAFDQTGVRLTIPVALGAHHLLVLAIDFASETAVSNVEDAVGNAYFSAGARAIDHLGGFATELWYAADTQPFTGDIAITIGKSSEVFVWLTEYDGIAASSPLAAESTIAEGVPQNGVTAASPITTTSADELVFVLAANNGGFGAIVAGNPFIALAPYGGDDSAYAILPAPGTYSAAWSVSMGSITTYCASVAAFYAGS